MALVSAKYRTWELQMFQMLHCRRCAVPAGKKRKVGVPTKECLFTSFTRNSYLCDAVPPHIRGGYDGVSRQAWTPPPLSLSYIQPHKPVMSQRIDQGHLEMGWCRHRYFSAHSVWGAFSTAVGRNLYCRCTEDSRLEQGVTFRQFYHQSPARFETIYAQTVLDT